MRRGLRATGCSTPRRWRDPISSQRTVALSDLVNRQDWEVCEMAQAGVRSRAFRNGGVYVPLGHHIRQFQ
ncbi:MAG: SRPBCC family protein [Thermomicrobiales bacterium]